MFGCAGSDKAKEQPDEFADAQSVMAYLEQQNEIYVKTGKNGGDLSESKRKDTAENGQHPYAVIVTCSDSRVPAEHIFNAGIGELFVIRTAGNVIGDHALGSVEYGMEHLGAKLVVVLGHTNCGAVDAALNGGAHGAIATITDEISACIPAQCDPREAEKLNVENSISRIMNSEIITEVTHTGTSRVVGAIYDIESGTVEFFE
jgi:carbonic anhydrase